MRKSKYSKGITLLLIIAAVTVAVTTYGAISATKTLSSSGSISATANLGVFSDFDCNNPITTIDWGSLTPGNTANQPIYVKNTGTGVSLSLSLATTSWSPSGADSYITITWDKTGTTLAPLEKTQAILSITPSSSITGITNFGVQIIVQGSS